MHFGSAAARAGPVGLGYVRVSRREVLAVAVTGGTLGGGVEGDAQPVLLLHGGPGLSYGCLDGLCADLGAGYRIAA